MASGLFNSALIDASHMLDMSKSAANNQLNLTRGDMGANAEFRHKGRSLMQRDEDVQAKKQMTSVMSGLDKFLSGRGEPVRSMAQGKGFNL